MKKYVMGALALVMALSMASCDEEKKVNPQPETVETVIGSYVSGVVTANGQPLQGVSISGGGASATTDASGAYSLVVSQPGTIEVTASLDGYIPSSGSVVVSESSIASIDFELTAQNAAVTVTPGEEQTLVEAREEVTSLTFPANALTEATDVTLTEYTARAASDNLGAISVVNCEPDGQTFAEPVRVRVEKSTSDEVSFAEMTHYVEENGKWVADGAMSVADGAYVCDLEHFSNHAFGVNAQWQAGSASTENGENVEINNLGQLNNTSRDVTVASRSGWEIDGDMSSLVRAALSGVSDSDASALASDLERMVRNAKGGNSNVREQQVSLGSIQVSGDVRVNIQVEYKIEHSTMQVPVIFRGQLVMISVPVIEYVGVSFNISYEYGTMRPEHSGGNLG